VGAPSLLSPAGADWDWAPAASADGQWLAFATGSPGKAAIAVMRRDGTARRVIAESPHISFGSPVWAPDNTRIGFGGSWDPGFGEIFIVAGGDPGVVQLTDTPNIEGTRIPTWPRSGSAPLAFTGKQGGIWRVFVMPTGGEPRAISPAGATAYAPAWSPDGTRLAFQGSRVQGMDGIFTVAPDGSDVRSVVQTGGGIWANAPVWSPDGRWLAYVSNREASTGSDYGDLYVVPASGGQSTRLTFDGQTYDWRVAWLP
jgi:TolB protein